MAIKIESGRQFAQNIDMTGSRFVSDTEDGNLSGVEFEQSNLAFSSFNNINFSQVRFRDCDWTNVAISYIQMGGSHFKQVSVSDGEDQQGIDFENAHLDDTIFKGCSLKDVAITNCNTKGMTIDGIPLQDLVDAYQKNQD